MGACAVVFGDGEVGGEGGVWRGLVGSSAVVAGGTYEPLLVTEVGFALHWFVGLDSVYKSIGYLCSCTSI